MNKTTILAILFLISLAIVIITINTDYNFERNIYFSNSISPYVGFTP